MAPVMGVAGDGLAASPGGRPGGRDDAGQARAASIGGRGQRTRCCRRVSSDQPAGRSALEAAAAVSRQSKRCSGADLPGRCTKPSGVGVEQGSGRDGEAAARCPAALVDRATGSFTRQHAATGAVAAQGRPALREGRGVGAPRRETRTAISCRAPGVRACASAAMPSGRAGVAVERAAPAPSALPRSAPASRFRRERRRRAPAPAPAVMPVRMPLASTIAACDLPALQRDAVAVGGGCIRGQGPGGPVQRGVGLGQRRSARGRGRGRRPVRCRCRRRRAASASAAGGIEPGKVGQRLRQAVRDAPRCPRRRCRRPGAAAIRVARHVVPAAHALRWHGGGATIRRSAPSRRRSRDRGRAARSVTVASGGGTSSS